MDKQQADEVVKMIKVQEALTELDTYKKWAWYLTELLQSHNIYHVRLEGFIKANNLPPLPLIEEL